MLRFGLNEALPRGCTAAWGCRAIITQDGSVDVPHDRQDAAGENRGALLAYLNEQAFLVDWRARAAALLKAGEIGTREAGCHLLYRDDRIEVWGDTKGSAGYLYVCAFWTDVLCKFCHEEHKPGLVSTYCPDAAREYHRAGAAIKDLGL